MHSLCSQIEDITDSLSKQLYSLINSQNLSLKPDDENSDQSLFYTNLDKVINDFKTQIMTLEHGILQQYSEEDNITAPVAIDSKSITPLTSPSPHDNSNVIGLFKFDSPFELYSCSSFFDQLILSHEELVLFKSQKYNIAIARKYIDSVPQSTLYSLVYNNKDHANVVVYINDEPHAYYFNEVIHYIVSNHLSMREYCDPELELLLEEFSFFNVPFPGELLSYLWNKRRQVLFKQYKANIPLYFRVYKNVYSLTQNEIQQTDNEEFIETILNNPLQEVDEYNHIILSNDLKYHKYMFQYLQNGSLTIDLCDDKNISDIQEEFIQCKVHTSINLWKYIFSQYDSQTPSNHFPDSTLMCSLNPDTTDILNEWLGTDLVWSNVYRLTSDGINMDEYHKRLDGIPNLLYIIRIRRGFIFGAFTSVGYKYKPGIKGLYQEDSRCFLFSLKNPAGKPLKFDCVNPSKALFYNKHAAYIVSLGVFEFFIKKYNNDILVGNIGLDGSGAYRSVSVPIEDTVKAYHHMLIGDQENIFDYDFIVDDLEVFQGKRFMSPDSICLTPSSVNTIDLSVASIQSVSNDSSSHRIRSFPLLSRPVERSSLRYSNTEADNHVEIISETDVTT